MNTIIATTIDRSIQIVFHMVSGSKFQIYQKAAAKLTLEGYPCSACEIDKRFQVQIIK